MPTEPAEPGRGPGPDACGSFSTFEHVPEPERTLLFRVNVKANRVGIAVEIGRRPHELRPREIYAVVWSALSAPAGAETGQVLLHPILAPRGQEFDAWFHNLEHGDEVQVDLFVDQVHADGTERRRTLRIRASRWHTTTTISRSIVE